MKGIDAQYAPPSVRDAFLRALEQTDRTNAVRLASTLVTCGNPCPGMVCELLELPIGSSYGSAARRVLAGAPG